MEEKDETGRSLLLSDDVEPVRPLAEALAADEVMTAFDLPIRVLIDEGRDTAAWLEYYYKADPGTGRPGFEWVEFRIPPDTAPTLRLLVAAAQAMHFRCILGRAQGNNQGLRADFEEGEQVLRTIRNTLDFYYDDGTGTSEDKDLAALANTHRHYADTVANLAAALHDYGRLAERDNKALCVIGTWDTALASRALELSERLTVPATPPDKSAIHLRNRFLTLISREVKKIRRAAEFLFTGKHISIFRDHFVSEYARNRRQERAKEKSNTAAPTENQAG